MLREIVDGGDGEHMRDGTRDDCTMAFGSGIDIYAWDFCTTKESYFSHPYPLTIAPCATPSSFHPSGVLEAEVATYITHLVV